MITLNHGPDKIQVPTTASEILWENWCDYRKSVSNQKPDFRYWVLMEDLELDTEAEAAISKVVAAAYRDLTNTRTEKLDTLKIRGTYSGTYYIFGRRGWMSVRELVDVLEIQNQFEADTENETTHETDADFTRGLSVTAAIMHMPRSKTQAVYKRRLNQFRKFVTLSHVRSCMIVVDTMFDTWAKDSKCFYFFNPVEAYNSMSKKTVEQQRVENWRREIQTESRHKLGWSAIVQQLATDRGCGLDSSAVFRMKATDAIRRLSYLNASAALG